MSLLFHANGTNADADADADADANRLEINQTP